MYVVVKHGNQFVNKWLWIVPHKSKPWKFSFSMQSRVISKDCLAGELSLSSIMSLFSCLTLEPFCKVQCYLPHLM